MRKDWLSMTFKNISISLLLMSLLGFLNPGTSFAEAKNFVIIIKNHTCSPSELIVPAKKKIKLIIENQDPTPEEFESFDLNREEVVPGNGKIIVFINALKPGRYKYFGDFHREKAWGTIIAQ